MHLKQNSINYWLFSPDFSESDFILLLLNKHYWELQVYTKTIHYSISCSVGQCGEYQFWNNVRRILHMHELLVSACVWATKQESADTVIYFYKLFCTVEMIFFGALHSSIQRKNNYLKCKRIKLAVEEIEICLNS